MKRIIEGLYQKIADAKPLFQQYNLLLDDPDGTTHNFYMDVYRSQPLEPELYEYFSLPAIFVDYTIQGQGTGNARLVTLTLHIILDDMPNTNNFSEQREQGFNRCVYSALLQKILEDARLTKHSGKLSFVSEEIVDEPVINYHIQTYQIEVYLDDMIGEPAEPIIGEFETVNISGKLVKQLNNGI